MGQVEERYFEVDGRKWRRTDPAIPERLRQELVNELMSARRAVKSGEPDARTRVADAKLALGERGRAWWEPIEDEAFAARAAATIRVLLRHRGPDKTICPSDVARAIGGEAWRKRMTQVRAVAAQLVSDGTLEVRQRGKAVDPTKARGPIRLALPAR